MTIHVIMGPPCSGKSTFVQTNAPPGVPRFDFDLIVSTVAGEDVKHATPPAVMDPVLAMRRGLMGWLLDAETTVDELWLINTRPSDNTLAALAGAGAEFHVLDPGMDECIARAEREGRPPGTVDRIRDWYNSPPVPPGEKGGHVPPKLKSFQIKADSLDEATGQFIGYASVFDVMDSYGDVVRKGAFTDTLAEWKDSGRTMPVLYGHDFADPFSNVGGVTEAVEDDHGLKITASLDLDNPKAAQVYRLLKEGRLSEMSFAYHVREGAWGEMDGQEVYELKALKLLEVSVVPIGANPDTSIVDVKSARALLSTAAKQADGPEREALTAALKALDTPGSSIEDAEESHNITPGRANAIRAQLAFLPEGLM